MNEEPTCDGTADAPPDESGSKNGQPSQPSELDPSSLEQAALEVLSALVLSIQRLTLAVDRLIEAMPMDEDEGEEVQRDLLGRRVD